MHFDPWNPGMSTSHPDFGPPADRLGLQSWPSHLAQRFQQALLGLHPEVGGRPMHCPDLAALGCAALLTPATRSELVRLRDQALAAAQRARADEAAREAR